jgi:hypothetical protein
VARCLPVVQRRAAASSGPRARPASRLSRRAPLSPICPSTLAASLRPAPHTAAVFAFPQSRGEARANLGAALACLAQLGVPVFVAPDELGAPPAPAVLLLQAYALHAALAGREGQHAGQDAAALPALRFRDHERLQERHRAALDSPELARFKAPARPSSALPPRPRGPTPPRSASGAGSLCVELKGAPGAAGRRRFWIGTTRLRRSTATSCACGAPARPCWPVWPPACSTARRMRLGRGGGSAEETRWGGRDARLQETARLEALLEEHNLADLEVPGGTTEGALGEAASRSGQDGLLRGAAMAAAAERGSAAGQQDATSEARGGKRSRFKRGKGRGKEP